jgi:hypothetical protein
MKRFLKFRTALLPCAAALLFATLAQADTLTGTTAVLYQAGSNDRPAVGTISPVPVGGW